MIYFGKGLSLNEEKIEFQKFKKINSKYLQNLNI